MPGATPFGIGGETNIFTSTMSELEAGADLPTSHPHEPRHRRPAEQRYKVPSITSYSNYSLILLHVIRTRKSQHKRSEGRGKFLIMILPDYQCSLGIEITL